jgi:hypothetical protein
MRLHFALALIVFGLSRFLVQTTLVLNNLYVRFSLGEPKTRLKIANRGLVDSNLH